MERKPDNGGCSMKTHRKSTGIQAMPLIVKLAIERETNKDKKRGKPEMYNTMPELMKHRRA